jgi:hypothetical protein
MRGKRFDGELSMSLDIIFYNIKKFTNGAFQLAEQKMLLRIYV